MNHKRISSGQKVALTLHVNRKPGSTMLESTCECGFLAELEEDQMSFEIQAPMPRARRRERVKQNYRADFLINEKMIVELKGCPSFSQSKQS